MKKLFQGLLPMLILLGLVLTSVLSVNSQDDQSGFMSIDCGIAEGYTDDTTYIKYVSDANSTDSGENSEILPEYTSDIDTQLKTLRSFPNNTRNCYTLNPPQGNGSRYLIRARFMYGNYDSMNGQLPEFDVYLGPDYWDTIKFNSSSKPTNREIIHVLSSDYIHVCLVNTGRGTPFISAIELRLLADDMYNETDLSLNLIVRRGYGSASGKIFRYGDDKYDRLWSTPVDLVAGYTSLSTSEEVDGESNTLHPPSEVMKTAITRSEYYSTYPLQIDLYSGNTADQFILYMHFAEIKILQENETREFSANLNNDDQYHWNDISPEYLKSSSFYALVEPSPNNLTITETLSSTLPPIINALEFYSLKALKQKQTYDEDAAAMMSIKSTYRLTKNWQGDPCAPHEFVWEGIRCSYDDTDSPRIVMLNLSTSGLIGEIDSRLANLKMMQTLDLSNNNLNGTVPDFLSGLKFLTELNLKGNSFTGPIPSGLLAKANKGSLSLSFDDESTGASASSCDMNTCKNNKNNVIAIASVIVSLIL